MKVELSRSISINVNVLFYPRKLFIMNVYSLLQEAAVGSTATVLTIVSLFDLSLSNIIIQPGVAYLGLFQGHLLPLSSLGGCPLFVIDHQLIGICVNKTKSVEKKFDH